LKQDIVHSHIWILLFFLIVKKLLQVLSIRYMYIRTCVCVCVCVCARARALIARMRRMEDIT